MLVLNGDLVFDPVVVDSLLDCGPSCMAVVQCAVGQEEMKFSLDAEGKIAFVSKLVYAPCGEAIGINLIRAHDLALVTRGLQRCDEMDYFERGLEIAIRDGLALGAVDVSRFPCVEIDYVDDLSRAKEIIGF